MFVFCSTCRVCCHVEKSWALPGCSHMLRILAPLYAVLSGPCSDVCRVGGSLYTWPLLGTKRKRASSVWRGLCHASLPSLSWAVRFTLQAGTDPSGQEGIEAALPPGWQAAGLGASTPPAHPLSSDSRWTQAHTTSFFSNACLQPALPRVTSQPGH